MRALGKAIGTLRPSDFIAPIAIGASVGLGTGGLIGVLAIFVMMLAR